MQASLDLGTNTIINVGAPQYPTDGARLEDIGAAIAAAQGSFTLSNVTSYVTATVPLLRANSQTLPNLVFIESYATVGDGGGGWFVLNPTDTTSADDGGTIIVDSKGNRWYRMYSGDVNVKWFGAVGLNTGDDSAAIQKAINVVKNNLAYTSQGTKRQTSVYLPAGIYPIGTSLDAHLPNGNGSTYAGFGIRGDHIFGSEIRDNLTLGRPALDCTNNYGMVLRDFNIKASGSSVSSCGILFAQDRDNPFITYDNVMENVGVVGSSSAVGAVIVQNSDLFRFSNLQAGSPNGIGVSVGWRQPVLYTATATGGSANTIVFPTGASTTSGFYVGYPIRLVTGPGAGTGSTPIGSPSLGRITAYNGATLTATVDINWANGSAASGTVFEVYAIQSAYANCPQSHDDCTKYTFTNVCQLSGAKPLVITGVPGAVDIGDTYLAYTVPAAGDIIQIAPMQSSDTTLGPIELRGRNCRTEYQGGTTANAINIIHDYSGTLLQVDIVGDMLGGINGGALFVDNGSAGIPIIHFRGEGFNTANLFNIGGSVEKITGSSNIPSPGHLGGTVGVWEFDWIYRSNDNNWWPFIFSTVSTHTVIAGQTYIPPARVVVPGTSGASNFGITSFSYPIAPTVNSYTGGSGQATLYQYKIPAQTLNGSLLPTHVPRTLRCEIGGHGSMTTGNTGIYTVYLRQNANSYALATIGNNTMNGGQQFNIHLIIQNVSGNFNTSGYIMTNNAITSSLTNFLSTGLDATQDMYLDIDVSSSFSGVLGVATQAFDVY